MKNNLRFSRLRPFLFFLTFISACNTTSKKLDEPSDTTRVNLNGSITIDYELGRDHYLLQIISQKTAIQVESYLDKHLLKQALISQEKYLAFLNKANRFVDLPRSFSTKNRPCRGPFTVVVKSGDFNKTAKGCRSSDEGSLGRLIREGEFLLYSEN